MMSEEFFTMTMMMSWDEVSPLVRSSVWMAMVGILMWGCLKALRVEAAWLHRVAWAVVLLQGVMVARVPVEWAVLPVVEERETVGRMEGMLARQDVSVVSGVAMRVDAEEVRAATGVAEEGGNWREGLQSLWVVGLVGGLAVYGMGYGGLLWALRRGRRAEDRFVGEWEGLLKRRGEKREVPLVAHAGLGPMLCLTPKGYRVVVPEGAWEEFTEGQRMAILEHELAHLQRGDVWKSLGARMLVLVHWFNPVAWWAVLRFEEAAEWACDQRLREAGPKRLAEYARAILTLAEPRGMQVAASFAGGAAISPRIRRMVAPQQRDGWMVRVVALLAVGGAFLGSLVQVRLVAQEDAMPSEAFEKQVEEFAGRLEVSGKTLEEFHAALGTKPGKIAMKEVVEWMEEELIDEALEDSVKQMFEGAAKDQGWRDELVEREALIAADLEVVEKVLGEVRDSLRTETEAEKLLARFLEQKESGLMVYLEEVQERLHPGMAMVEDHLGEVFERNEEGGYELLEGSEEGERGLEMGLLMKDVHELIHEEMVEFVEEIGEPDDLHKRFKELALEEEFAMAVVAWVLDEDGEGLRPREVVERVFQGLEEAMVDEPEGLIFEGDGWEEVEEFVDHYELLRDRLEVVEGLLGEFGERIVGDDEVHDEWRELLGSRAGKVLFAFHMEVGDAEPEEVVRSIFEGVFEERGGKLQVREEMEEEVAEQVRDVLPGTREIRRKGRAVDALMEGVADEALAEALGSLAGKWVLIDSIRGEWERMAPDRFQHWQDEYFMEGEDGKLRLKEDAMEHIEEWLELVEETRGIEE